MINVTKPFLPPQEEYNQIIKGIWDRTWLTNNGPLVKELELALQNKLNVPAMHVVTNGTMALQLAIKALDLKGEVITTPFSFVATTTSIIWENCTPVYVDIRPDTLCIDADQIEQAITEKTSAILATHVYGVPCDVEKIDQIAKKYNLKVIYDAAHAFGVKYKGKSLLTFGDISTVSFHATKVFHTVEGGGIIVNQNIDALNEKVKLLRSFGFEGDHYELAGTNAKVSEFHAAMGIVNLNYLEENHEKRRRLYELYSQNLSVEKIYIPSEIEWNYSYYPVIFKSEQQLLKIEACLKEQQIFARRYFYPSLNELKYVKDCTNEVAEDVARRILCLPFYTDLEEAAVLKICSIIEQNLA